MPGSVVNHQLDFFVFCKNQIILAEAHCSYFFQWISGSFVLITAQKMKFFIKDFFSNPQETANLVTFTEEIRNGKLHF